MCSYRDDFIKCLSVFMVNDIIKNQTPKYIRRIPITLPAPQRNVELIPIIQDVMINTMKHSYANGIFLSIP